MDNKARIINALVLMNFLNKVSDRYAQTEDRSKFNWYKRESNKYEFHPVILDILKNHEPADLKTLVFEYPHASINDPSRLSYTESDSKGLADRQTVTTFNRYVRRHFPSLADHEVRDYGTKCTVDHFEFWTTLDEIVFAAQVGPRSCMTWNSEYTPSIKWHSSLDEQRGSVRYNHPYRVYDPSLGWKMAVRLNPEKTEILGRCLVYEPGKCFVRSFKKGKDYSYSDESLEFFLTEAGYEHQSYWLRGTKIAKIQRNGDYLLPYLDGDHQGVSVYSDYCEIVPDDEAEYICDNTNGIGSSSRTEECTCCGEYVEADQLGETDDEDYGLVCEGCRDYRFNFARYNTSGGENFIHEDNIVYDIYDDPYDVRFADRIGLIETSYGNWALLSECMPNENDEYVHGKEIDAYDLIVIDGVAYERDSDALAELQKENEENV